MHVRQPPVTPRSEVTGPNPGLGLPRATATSLVGAYGGLVYVSTVVGCWVADRVLGAIASVW